GVKFHDEPTEQMWGIEAVFEDLYGNLIDLIQRFES
ncbi:MAG TPA: glyoxalase, partial [Candidatus Binatia bacterium]|nr:glyoxalase [Candidatus Binatia bacterium]